MISQAVALRRDVAARMRRSSYHASASELGSFFRCYHGRSTPKEKEKLMHKSIGCFDSFDAWTNWTSPAYVLGKLVENPRKNKAMKFYNCTGYVDVNHGPNGLQDITGRGLALIAMGHMELQNSGYKATEVTVFDTFTVDMSSTGMHAAQVQSGATISRPLVLHKFRSSCQNISRPLTNPQGRERFGLPWFSKSSGSSSSKPSSRNMSTSSPSGSATSPNGHALLQDRIRSLLSHDLALPLFHALHGRDPGKQIYLSRESRPIPDACGDNIFEEAIRAWALQSPIRRKEPKLVRYVSEMIQDLSEQLHLKSDNEVEVKQLSKSQQEAPQKGRIDILLSSQQEAPQKGRIDILLSSNESPSIPLALIEIGRNNTEWWKKFDQAGKYLDIMNDDSMDQKLKFQDAMLCAILTFDEGGDAQEFQSQLGVFLCWPKTGNPCRMALLWHACAFDLMSASKDFGRFLRVVSSFAVWLKAGPNADYKYLSSNVCRVGNTVLRSYDLRFRKTERSPEIYLDSRCKDIVGGEVSVVVDSSDGANTEVLTHDNPLRIIAFPYKNGTHGAKQPTDFIPIIDELIKLHSLGYVHGDIRGFNVVFGDESGLIDFDLSGIPGKRTYPQGYREDLRDGFRLGTGYTGDDDNKLDFYHDWFAFGNLMFIYHDWNAPPNFASEAESRLNKTLVKWSKLKSQPSSSDIEELKDDLRYFDQQKWTVCPAITFAKELSRFKDQEQMDTFGGATGSPKQRAIGKRFA